jgi:2-isopropylmalate synthase
MLQQPQTKYSAFKPVTLAQRDWPSRQITHAPLWMSTDLRDGNQALFEPMNSAKKFELFRTLCEIGFKEIEIAFPSASQTEFDFVRELIEGNHIPDDVTIEVLTQAREHLIRRTFESLRGAKKAIVHVYNATSPTFRNTVFNMTQTEVISMAVNAVQLIKDLAAAQPETQWTLQYSPENFTATELPFVLEVCNAVTATWGATPTNKVILNLPATVEMATPNIHADQIEWMHKNLERRDSVLISVHPHNDRGTAVAAAELALMAGADRVEGCLFGNGERTGNVDLVTLALNLYTQGINPNLDFSNINAIARTVEECTQLPIHPRHPYVGDLVFTAFSGSHQDAINKGFKIQPNQALWNVPYLPIDPRDVGRSYDSVIRVNSQSGKGGIAYLLEQDYGIVLPRRMQIEFAGIVQKDMDTHGREISAADIWQLFNDTYVAKYSPLKYSAHHLYEAETKQGVRLAIEINGQTQWVQGEGNGPIDAAVQALKTLGVSIQVRSYEERSMSASQSGGNAKACAFMELAHEQQRGDYYGVGIDENIITASFKALISAANRLGMHATRLEQAA